MNLEYKYQNFYNIIENNAKEYGKKTIIFTEEGKLNNIQLQKKIDTFATTKLGAIAVPINTFLKHEELEYIFNDSGAKLLIIPKTFQKELPSLF